MDSIGKNPPGNSYSSISFWFSGCDSGKDKETDVLFQVSLTYWPMDFPPKESTAIRGQHIQTKNIYKIIYYWVLSRQSTLAQRNIRSSESIWIVLPRASLDKATFSVPCTLLPAEAADSPFSLPAFTWYSSQSCFLNWKGRNFPSRVLLTVKCEYNRSVGSSLLR